MEHAVCVCLCVCVATRVCMIVVIFFTNLGNWLRLLYFEVNFASIEITGLFNIIENQPFSRNLSVFWKGIFFRKWFFSRKFDTYSSIRNSKRLTFLVVSLVFCLIILCSTALALFFFCYFFMQPFSGLIIIFFHSLCGRLFGMAAVRWFYREPFTDWVSSTWNPREFSIS